MKAEDVRAAIVARYGSIHSFCRQHPELKRSTVYMVLSGRYAGSTARQEAKIRAAALNLPPEDAMTKKPLPEQRVVDTLQHIRCKHCRRLDKGHCRECRTQTDKEARELCTTLFHGR